MAIVSISRIQVRRGQASQGSGVPQLAGGEFGWAVDTQALYIGNGSVAEGAPSVGNTKVLTEHDNLFELAEAYIYGDENIVQTGATSGSPIQRTLKERLDDYVSVRSFGVVGDGIADDTTELQRAIDQLFINPSTVGNTSSRVYLTIPAGTYRISNTITLPPFATLIGDGSEKTKIIQTANADVFRTVNGLSTPGTPGNNAATTTLNQARHIALKGMTLEVNGDNTAIYLYSCANSDFEDIKCVGDWSSSDSYTDNFAVKMDSLSSVVTCANNNFSSIKAEGFIQAVHSDYDALENHFTNCRFHNCKYGVVFGENTVIGSPGQSSGPINNSLTNCEFNEIYRHGIWIREGVGNKSSMNNFSGVGNDGGTESNATYSCIKFETLENASLNDWFYRTELLSTDAAYLVSTPYIPEIEGYVDNTTTNSFEVDVGYSVGYVTSFRLPANVTKTYIINYLFKSTYVNAVRKGTLDITVNKNNNTTSITDTYDYVGDVTYQTNLDFQAQLTDINADTNQETLLVKVKDSTLNDQATILFQVQVKS